MASLSFLGLPYARPPVGEDFKPPEPLGEPSGDIVTFLTSVFKMIPPHCSVQIEQDGRLPVKHLRRAPGAGVDTWWFGLGFCQ